jgi:hypothetical protein
MDHMKAFKGQTTVTHPLAIGTIYLRIRRKSLFDKASILPFMTAGDTDGSGKFFAV